MVYKFNGHNLLMGFMVLFVINVLLQAVESPNWYSYVVGILVAIAFPCIERTNKGDKNGPGTTK